MKKFIYDVNHDLGSIRGLNAKRYCFVSPVEDVDEGIKCRTRCGAEFVVQRGSHFGYRECSVCKKQLALPGN